MISKSQARKVAQQIHTRFGARIAAACKGTAVPTDFVAGLISNEAGKDRSGNIKEDATRFEPGVFRKLQQVRDGVRKSWSGIRQADLKDSDDGALRALATSYSLTQVMGWHCIHSLSCTVAQLRDPQQHLHYAVRLLQMNAADGDFQRKAFAGEFREWNSGSESGKTYDKDYVANGAAVMEAYRTLGEPPLAESHQAVVQTEPVNELPVKVDEHGDTSPQETVVVPPVAAADSSSKKSMWATIVAGFTAAMTWVLTNVAEIFGKAKDSGFNANDAIRWTLILLGVVFALFMLRQLVMGVVRLLGSIAMTRDAMRYHADPTKINVVVGQPAPPKEASGD